MRIGLDCRTILQPDRGEAAGVGHYTYQLARHLVEQNRKLLEPHTLVLFFDRQVTEEAKLHRFRDPGVEVFDFPFIQYKKFLPVTYSHFLVAAFLRRAKLDVFHSPIPHLPLSYGEPSVVTVHDVAIYKYPDLFPKGQQFSTKVVVPQIIKRAHKIIAVSKTTKNDLRELFGVPEDSITVIYNGLDPRFFQETAPEEIAQMRKTFSIQKPYILFLSTLEPRKNVERLIDAYTKVRDRGHDVQLVLAGKEGWGVEKIYDRAARSPHKKDILFTGYVESDLIRPLFAGAEVFVSPSIYEGFGMPVTEALAQGVPVVTSRFGSLPEVVGQAAELVDPYSVTDIRDAIDRILSDPALRARLKAAGQLQARKYAWDRCALETLKVYEQIGKRSKET